MNKNFCTNCKKELEDGNRFCSNCGKEIIIKKESTGGINSKKKRKQHWIFWWKLNKEEINYQIENYNSLKITQSARGISFLLMLFSSLVTLIFIIVNYLEIGSLVDVFLMLFIGLFIYKGKRWAMILGMILWTIEKFYMIYHGMNSSLIQILWWAIYMSSFWLAYNVENERRFKKDS